MALALSWIIWTLWIKKIPCFMRNKQPGILALPLRSSKTSTTAGGSLKRSSSAPPEYQTHLKEPCGFRKQELGGLVHDSSGMVSMFEMKLTCWVDGAD